MFLHTLGSLFVVVGLSYLLVKASWQIVLLSFMASGVGVAIWRVRNAFVRRSKIKGLWKRSMEIDSMLDELDELYPKLPVTRQPAYAASAANFAEPPKQSIRDLTRINRVARAERPVAARAQQAPQVVPRYATSRNEARKFSMSKLANSRTYETPKPRESRETYVPRETRETYVPPVMAPAVHELGIHVPHQASAQFSNALDDLYPLSLIEQKQAAAESYGLPLFVTKPAPWQIEAQSITH